MRLLEKLYRVEIGESALRVILEVTKEARLNADVSRDRDAFLCLWQHRLESWLGEEKPVE